MSPRRRHNPAKPGARYHRLAAAVRRLTAEVRAPHPRDPRHTQPHTDWEQQTESRLRAIEQQLANQNRLLVIAIVTLAGDILLGLTR
jgi:hypothetical protein